MATVVFLHAHPDDEAIATGGTMASLAARGHRVVLVTATGGELGEVPDGLLAPGETLAGRRAAELAEACTALGVARQVFLGYTDSGMADEPTNVRPGCFAAADVDEAARRLAGLLDEEGAQVLVTYDEHGGYGHPDHVQVHAVGMRAAELARTEVVYLATMDRGAMQALRDRADGLGTDDGPGDAELDQFDTLGEPSERITTEVDVTPFLAAKRAGMTAHASQIGPASPFLAVPDELFAEIWGREWYVRIRPAPDGLGDGRREGDLLVGGAGASPTRRSPVEPAVDR